MLFQTLTVSEAAHILLDDDNANWTYDGAHALADYLDEFSEDCGGPAGGFCRVVARCEYSEYSPSELVDSYGYLLRRDLPSDSSWVANCEEIMSELTELIQDETVVICVENGNFIVALF